MIVSKVMPFGSGRNKLKYFEISTNLDGLALSRGGWDKVLVLWDMRSVLILGIETSTMVIVASLSETHASPVSIV